MPVTMPIILDDAVYIWSIVNDDDNYNLQQQFTVPRDLQQYCTLIIIVIVESQAQDGHGEVSVYDTCVEFSESIQWSLHGRNCAILLQQEPTKKLKFGGKNLTFFISQTYVLQVIQNEYIQEIGVCNTHKRHA